MLMKYCIIAFLVCVSLGLQAQDTPSRAQSETATLTALYQLDEAQTTEMLRIQERRFNNQQEIEPLRTTDYRLYLQKRHAIRVNTDSSIRRMLSPEQITIFNDQQAQRRLADSQFIKEMLQAGKTKEEIELLVLERN